MKRLAFCLLLLSAPGLSIGAADSGKADSLLTDADLQAYYKTIFQITPSPQAVDPVRDGGGELSQVVFASTGPEVRKHNGSLLVRQCASLDAARTVAATVCKMGGGATKVEEVAGTRDEAFSFGWQLNAVRGNVHFIVAVSGLTAHRDVAQSRAAAMALAKAILARLQ